MYSYINIDEISVNNECKLRLERLYHLYAKHEYDLLGSGFVKVDYEINAKGFLGRRYVDRQMVLYGSLAKKKLKHRCSDTYDPINWFVDYKSGFFFSPWKYSSQEKCYRVMNEKEGVDIKCPWELGRFYHLLQLSVLAIVNATLRESIILEFRNEMLDFIEMNPVGKTVQWSSTMDISIRMVNVLLSYDILMQLDTKGYLDQEFQAYFEVHIYETIKFVMTHLEYAGRTSTNHYLSNIAGIIFAAAYLPESEWLNACLVFGVQELIEQVGTQFYEEGSHFEGSTCYHRLSTEFVLYSVALIYGILKTERKNVFLKYNSSKIKRLRHVRSQRYDVNETEFFPRWFIDRLCNAGFFTNIILKNNNEIVQIGDNDSGRLLKLTPMISVNEKNMEENVLDHRTLLSALNGIFTNKEFVQSGKELPLESSLIQSLSKRVKMRGNVHALFSEKCEERKTAENIYEYTKESMIFRSDEGGLLDDVEIYNFDEFGIVVLRGSRLYVSMVVDTAQNSIHVGHTHNDKLSIEVMIDGNYITRDPGGYIYTASPQIRDKFRSVKAHNTIRIVGCEQNFFDGIWGIKKRVKAELLYCSKKRITAKVSYGDIKCLRDISLTDNKIIVNDYANKPFKVAFHNKLYSDGYGKLKRTIL